MNEYWEAARRLSHRNLGADINNPEKLKAAFEAELEAVRKENAAASGNDTDSGQAKEYICKNYKSEKEKSQ